MTTTYTNSSKKIKYSNDCISFANDYPNQINNFPALKYVLNINIPNHGTKYASLPNYLQACNIWLIWDKLKEIDPTFSAYAANTQFPSTYFGYTVGAQHRVFGIGILSCDQDNIYEHANIDPIGCINTYDHTYLAVPIRDVAEPDLLG